MNISSKPTGKTLPAMAAALLASLTGGCQSTETLTTVDYVDLERFMGAWYVIASIPTFIETDAYNAVETYTLRDDGSIDTVFTFRKGGFDGKQKRYNPRGFVRDTRSNAVWGMQFIWPIKADYRIIYLDDDYQTTVVGHNKRNYVWLMAREPAISESKYQDAVSFIESVGYDVSELRRVPQQW